MVTVSCVFNNVVGAAINASLQILDYMGIIYDEFSLTHSPQSADFNVSAYPIGTYVVRLICDGIIADVKTFVKH
jgi:hypothetical protein